MKRIISLVLISLLSFSSNVKGQTNLILADTLNLGQSLAGIWHYRHSSGSEYAIVGASEGICIVDISTPTAAALVMQLPGASSIWHEVKVLGDYAYAVSEGIDTNNILNGLQIIDLRYLPDSAPNKFYTGDGLIANQLTTAHSVTVDGHTVFLNGHNISSIGRGVLFLDVTDPWNPIFTGSINDNYCHDSYVRNNSIYTSDIYAGQFSVYDISNQAAPILQATQLTPGLFNHNTWLSDDSHIIYAADEKANAPLASFDITDLGNITLLDTFYNGNFTSNEVHNVRVINNYLICPSYGSQITIVDAARPKNLIEIGNYPTGGFLCWDADPYTASGSIIATDMTGIFYVFTPEYHRACYLEGIVTDSVTGITLNGVEVTIQGTGVTALTNPLGEFYSGYADTGTYVITFTKLGYNTQTISFNFQSGVLDSIAVKLVPVGSGISNPLLSDLLLYPNPASDYLIITTPLKECTYKIYDMTFKMILSGKLAGQNKTIETKNLPAGAYSVEIFNGKEAICRKVVIRK